MLMCSPGRSPISLLLVVAKFLKRLVYMSSNLMDYLPKLLFQLRAHWSSAVLWTYTKFIPAPGHLSLLFFWSEVVFPYTSSWFALSFH